MYTNLPYPTKPARNFTKRLRLLPLLLVLMGTSFLASASLAQVSAADNPTSHQVTAETPIQGTIRVAEGADFQQLAKITMDQAKAAALAAFPGATFDEGELEAEDGFLVYEIELKKDRQEIEVLIDAGNGAMLHAEQEIDD